MIQSNWKAAPASILSAALAGLVAASIASAGSPPLATATHQYGWGDCNWQWKDDASSQSITWKYDGAYPFPPNGNGDGVVNSFTGRVSDAMGRWNGALSGFGALARLSQVPSSSGANIVISYVDIFGAEFGATTITTIATNSCVLHSTTDMQMRAAHVYLTPKDNWFTQDDSRRSYWETNCPAGTGTTYTCSKRWDFGSTFAHEMGHALAIAWHPDQINSSANDIAECVRVDSSGRPLWRATMCPSNSAGYWANRWRSERRTLHSWDTTSLRYTFTMHD